MKPTKKHLTRRAVIVLTVTVLLLAGLSAAAAIRLTYKSASDGYVRQTVNRVDLSVDHTTLVFDPPADDGMLRGKVTVQIAKAEADFYGMLNSITIEGADAGQRVYAPARANGEGYDLPESLLLPAENGKTRPLSWTITFAAELTVYLVLLRRLRRCAKADTQDSSL